MKHFDLLIDSKGKDGKNKPLKFSDDGKLIVQYTKDEHEDTSQPINKRYRYYEDLYGNQYRWTTHKQGDGKFHATILKANHSHGWLTYTTKKQRSFTKRKTGKAWCLKAYLKAKERQEKVFKERAERKKVRLDLKPKGVEKSLLNVANKIKHFKQLQKKIDTKLKSLNTRRKNYGRKIRYYEKRKAILKWRLELQ